MRRLPRLRAPGAAALGSAQLCFTHTSLAAPARTTTTATILSASTTTSGLQTKTTTTTTTTRHDQRRCLSTTLSRPARARKPPSVLEDPGKPKYEFDQALANLDEQLTTNPAPDVPTRLAYPGEILAAPEPDAVDDPTYKPATTAEGLEEVGGTADWWEQPAHWGTEGGASEFVWSFVGTFGPLDKVTDPAMLEVLVKRAVVEALAVSRFASPSKAKGVDKLFAHSDALDRLRKVVSVEIVPSASGAATLKEYKDFYRVWHVLQSALPKPAKKEGEAGQQEGVQEDAQEAEAPAAEEPAAAQSESATAEQTPEETTTEVVEGVYKPESLTPEEARELIAGWDKGWKKAVLRSPAVKFYAAKRIQQLTGHRIPDGKLVGDVSIATLIAATLTPPKPKKLAQVLQERQAFQGLPNVRVFPRRVTPIDEEIMAGRWKLIVRELEKRKLPVTGTGDFSPAVETRWVAGDA